MMDLAREFGGETVRLSEIEALIAQTAKARYDILVTAVYWRINDHVAVGIPQKALPRWEPLCPQPLPQPVCLCGRLLRGSCVAPCRAGCRRSAPVRPAPIAQARPEAAAVRPAPRYEPIEADEVAAFKRALSDAAGARAAPAAASKPGVPLRSGPLLPPSRPTGFEDTVMPGADGASPDLSSTQYGDLN